MKQKLSINNDELYALGYRVLCWTCNYSTCECRAYSHLPAVHFPKPSPRNSKGLPLVLGVPPINTADQAVLDNAVMIRPKGYFDQEWSAALVGAEKLRHTPR